MLSVPNAAGGATVLPAQPALNALLVVRCSGSTPFNLRQVRKISLLTLEGGESVVEASPFPDPRPTLKQGGKEQEGMFLEGAVFCFLTAIH